MQNVPSVVVRKPPPVKAGNDLDRPRKKARTDAILGRSIVATPVSDMQRYFHARSCTQMTEQEARAAFADPRGEPDSDNEEDMAAWEVSACIKSTALACISDTIVLLEGSPSQIAPRRQSLPFHAGCRLPGAWLLL